MRPTTPMRVIGALLLVVVIVVAAPPRASEAGTAEASPTVRLVEQSPWVPMGYVARFTVAADGPPDSTLTLTIHREVRTRDELLAALGGDVGPVLGRTPGQLDALRRSDGTATIEIGTQQPGAPRDDDLVELARSGVYPARITLETPDGTESAELVTFLVAVDTDGQAVPTLPVALVVPVQARPLRLPDDTPDPDVVDELRPGGRLERIASELADVATPASIVVGGETITEWSRLASEDDRVAPGLEALAAATAAPGREIVAAPHVRLDIPALVARDLADEVAPQLRAGSDDLVAALGTRIDPRLVVVDTVDADSIDVIATESFVDRLVVPESAIVDAASDVAQAGRAELDAAGTPIDVAVSDDLLLLLTAIPGSTAQQVHRLTAMLTLDAIGGSKGATLVLPPDWNPDDGYLRSLLETLDVLPFLAPLTLDEWFSTVAPAGSDDEPAPPIEIGATDVGTAPVTSAQLARARLELSTLTTLLGEDDPRVRRGADAILRAPSADFAGASGRARVGADLDAITTDAESFLAGIHVDEKAVTLTGQRATIPITFRNETDRPVTVGVTFESPKLVFPDGDHQQLELAVGTTTERVDVEARTSGSFSMTVSMTTADGVFPIGQPARISIRTTIFGGVGGWIAAGAAAFLGGWWLIHAVRTRRQRREATP